MAIRESRGGGGVNKIIAQIEIPAIEELLAAIEEHEALTKQLEENAMKIHTLYLQINLKLKENQ